MWVPAESCTLPTADRPLRLAEFDELFATSLRSVERAPDGVLRLRLDGSAQARARDLTAREADCCSFFDFAVVRDGDQVVVEVRVPAGREDILDGLERQARGTGSRSA